MLVLMSIQLYLHSGGDRCGSAEQAAWLGMKHWQLGLPDYGVAALMLSPYPLDYCFERIVHEYIIPHIGDSPDVMAELLAAQMEECESEEQQQEEQLVWIRPLACYL